MALVANACTAADRSLTATDALIFRRTPTLTFECERSGEEATATASWSDRDRDGIVDRGDLIELDGRDCDGELELTLEVRTLLGDRFGIHELRGDLTFTMSAEADAGSVRDIDGSLSMSYTTPEPETVIALTEVEVDRTTGGLQDRLAAATVEVVVDHATQQTSYEFSGTVEDGTLDESFGFDTPIELLRDAAVYPTTGQVLLRAGPSRVRVATRGTGIHRESVLIGVDGDGDGGYTDEMEVYWQDLSPGTRSPFDFFTIPRGLYIYPNAPTTDRRLVVIDRIGGAIRGQGALDYQIYRNDEWVADTNVIYPNATTKGDVWEARASFESGTDRVWSASARIWNDPPGIAANLAPEQPDTADAVVVSVEVKDRDDDPVSVDYEWRVNDEIVADVHGATLPAARHSRDDIVTVAVEVDDGEAKVLARLTTNIVDAQPRIAADDSPAAVTYGDRVEFNVSVVDPDEDEVPSTSYQLDFGPPGMAIEAESGRVSWTATDLPMFDAAMDVHWQASAQEPGVEPLRGTLRVVDQARSYAIFRTGARTNRYSELSVADLDGDGDSEVLAYGTQGPQLAEWDGDDYVQSWAYPFPLHVVTGIPRNYDALAHADIDGDGRHEIFTSASGSVSRLDGVERRVATSVVMEDGRCKDLEVADVDGDGSVELICIAFVWEDSTGGSQVFVFSPDDLEILWRSDWAADQGYSIAIGNVDADAALEIVTSGGYVYDGSSYGLQWRSDTAFARVSLHDDIHVGDIDGDGIDEVVGDDVYDAVGRRQRWELPVDAPDTRVAVGDVVGDDGKAEVILWHQDATHLEVYVFDDQEGDLVAGIEAPLPSGSGGPRDIVAGDADHDGRDEIVVYQGFYSVIGFNPDPELERTSRYQGWFEHYMGGQFERVDGTDSSPAVLFAAYNRHYPREYSTHLRTIRLSTETGLATFGAWSLSSWPPHNAIAMDYDLDQDIELVAATGAARSLDLYAYDPTVDRWSVMAEFDLGTSSVTWPASADVNGDGHPDLLVAERRNRPKVYAYDAYNGRVLLEADALQDDGIVEAVAGADLDRDGYAEIIVATDEGVTVVFSRGPEDPVFRRTTHRASGYDVIVDDVEDGPELWLVGHYRVARWNAEFQHLGTFYMESDWRRCPETVWCGQGPGYWLLDGHYRYESANGESQLLVAGFSAWHSGGTESSKVIAYDVASGGKIWESPALHGRVRSIHGLQIDGRAVLSVATSRGIYLTR